MDRPQDPSRHPRRRHLGPGGRLDRGSTRDIFTKANHIGERSLTSLRSSAIHLLLKGHE